MIELVSNYRRNGHSVAKLDPLGLRAERHLPQLSLAYHGLEESDPDAVFDTGRWVHR